MKFQVITKVPELEADDADGNLALALPLYVDSAMDGHSRLVRVDEGALNFRAPVFRLGEVVIVDDNGREIVGRGRKADKWSVSYEEFNGIYEAVTRAQEVT